MGYLMQLTRHRLVTIAIHPASTALALSALTLILAACGNSKREVDTVEFIAQEIADCVTQNHPTVPRACAEAYGYGYASELLGEYENEFDVPRGPVTKFCEAFLPAVNEQIRHSSDTLLPKQPDRAWTILCATAAETVIRSSSPSFLWAAPTDRVPECGASERGLTICASDAPFPDDSVVLLAMTFDGPIPLDDPDYHHQYGFVFDSDGDSTNNYQASPAYPNDFFKDTDRWYVLEYAPDLGWRFDVKTAFDGQIVDVDSPARVTLSGSMLILVLPASEMIDCAPYRMTAFTHKGDYGLEPPHEWSADTEPTVDKPLETSCFMVDDPS